MKSRRFRRKRYWVVLGMALGLAVPVAKAAPEAPQEDRSQQQPSSEAQKRADEERRRARAEEMFLRMQFEVQLNEIARWDAENGRVVLKDPEQFDGAPTGVIEAAIEIVAEPAGGGRLRFRQDIQIRPFVLAFQKFMANGGLEELQRASGDEQLPDGLPPKIEELFADLIEALNAQDDDTLSAQERRREQEREQFMKRLERVLREGFELPEQEVERHLRLILALDRRLQREFAGGRFVERLREAARSERTERVLERLLAEAEALAESEQLPPWLKRIQRALSGEKNGSSPPGARPKQREPEDRSEPEDKRGLRGPIGSGNECV